MKLNPHKLGIAIALGYLASTIFVNVLVLILSLTNALTDPLIVHQVNFDIKSITIILLSSYVLGYVIAFTYNN